MDNGGAEGRGQLLRWVRWGAVGLMAALAIAPLGRFVWVVSDWLDYPYPRSGTEGLTLYESLVVKSGENIYDPITTRRFISAPYPPVYYLLASTVLPSTRPDFSQPGKIPSLFEPGRLISLLAAFATALMIPLLVVLDRQYVRGRDHDKGELIAGGLIGGALWLTLPPVLVWSLVFRSDMLMAAFTAVGLVCIALGSRHPAQGEKSTTNGSSRIDYLWLILGAVAFALAFFSKQTAFAGPVAAALYLLFRDWRLGLKWMALMAVLVLVPFALIDLATGHWFYLKMVDYHALPFRLSILTRLLHTAFWDDQWPLIMGALTYALYQFLAWWRGGRKEAAAPGLVPFFALAAFVSLLSAGVVGADHNHLLLPGLAACACAGSLIAVALSKAKRLSVRELWPLAGVTALVCTYLLGTSAPASAYDVNLEVPAPERQEQMRKIIDNVARHPSGTFFTDSAGILALAGKQTPYDDPFTMNILAQQGRWDESGLREMLRQGEFGLLVLACDVINTERTCQLTPGVIDAIRDGYRVEFKDILFTYAPK